MSSSTDMSRSIEYISSSSDDVDPNVGFKIRLFHDYKHTAWLPAVPAFGETKHWILIRTTDNRIYKVEIVKTGESLLLQRGWSILAAVENLHEGDKLMFQIEGTDKLRMWIHSPAHHAPPIGFSPGRMPPLLGDLPIQQIVQNSRTTITPTVHEAIRKVWNISSFDGRVYVSRLLISPSEGNFLIFNKRYTRFVPKQNANIAMRFIGSDIIMPGAIKTYRDGSTRMVKEWPMYAAGHHLTFGETFVCKIHRGPAVWEFVGCCAGR